MPATTAADRLLASLVGFVPTGATPPHWRGQRWLPRRSSLTHPGQGRQFHTGVARRCAHGGRCNGPETAQVCRPATRGIWPAVPDTGTAAPEPALTVSPGQRRVTCDVTFDVTTAASIALQVAAAGDPSDGRTESLEVVSNGAPLGTTVVGAPAGGREH